MAYLDHGRSRAPALRQEHRPVFALSEQRPDRNRDCILGFPHGDMDGHAIVMAET